MTTRFYLSFETLPGTPRHALSRGVIIGSEVGDIVIKGNKTISPRHCTISVQDDVLALVDHGSEFGTFVNNKKVTAGKTYLINSKDFLVIGDTPVKIEREGDSITLEEAKVVVKEAEKVTKQYLRKIEHDLHVLEEVEPPEQVKRVGGVWAIFRMLSVIIDALTALIVHTLLNPYVDYKNFLKQTEIAINLKLLPLIEQSEVFEDIITELTPYYRYLILYVIIRLATGFLLGVTWGQYLIGMRNFSSFWWGRIASIIQTLLGLVLGPFIVFDLPSLFMKRTFKEWVTYSVVELQTKYHALVGVVVFLPLIIFLTLASPLFQGFEVIKKVPFITKEIPVLTEVKVLGENKSDFFKFSSKIHEDLEILSFFELVQGKDSKKIIPYLQIIDKQDSSKISFNLFKNFSFNKLLIIDNEMNPFFRKSYPITNEFIHDIGRINKNFTNKRWTESTKLRLNEEIENVFKKSFSLDMSTLGHFIQENGPFIKGYVEFREAVLYMLDYPDITEINVVRLGNTRFFRFIEDNRAANLRHYLIPINAEHGVIYRVTFDSRNFVKSFYDKFLTLTQWNFNEDKLKSTSLNSGLQSKANNVYDQIDFTMNKNLGYEKRFALNEFTFNYLYEKAVGYLQENKTDMLTLLTSSTRSYIQVLTLLSEDDSIEETQKKLNQTLQKNLSDMLEALEKKNLMFFGLELREGKK
ncbi:MAG: FHA domain-containing protein [Bacteriovoracaceae bacterium]|nr:FHA domain-containing protein [Bacteriovoracaceae bacterium]